MLTRRLIKIIFRPAIFIFLLSLISPAASAQVYSNKEVGKKILTLQTALRIPNTNIVYRSGEKKLTKQAITCHIQLVLASIIFGRNQTLLLKILK